MFNFNVTFKKDVPCNPSVFFNKKKIDSVDMVVSKGKKNLKENEIINELSANNL